MAQRNIDTETVAEAVVDFFSRLGVREEILSDLGTQFVSDCMKAVTRLLSIKQLNTTPYHPMGKGVSEKFNGTQGGAVLLNPLPLGFFGLTFLPLDQLPNAFAQLFLDKEHLLPLVDVSIDDVILIDGK